MSVRLRNVFGARALRSIPGWILIVGGLLTGFAEPTDEGPQKVVVGTGIFPLFDSSLREAGLEVRMAEIERRVAAMAEDARVKTGRGLDIALFPENSLNARGPGSLWERAISLDGRLDADLGKIARENGTYLALSFNMREAGDAEAVSNVAVLYNRLGERVGLYRKAFPVPDPQGQLEGGKLPGREFPVFTTDFGRVAIAICYDLGFDELFDAFAAQGAELVLWPTMSPQTFMPRVYARRGGFFIVSATPRDNASIFDPMGEIAAQVRGEGILTAEIDLNSELVHWYPGLNGGESLREKFGDRVGFRYSETEDTGLFWSNDPTLPISGMLKAVGVPSERELRNKARTLRAAELEESAGPE